MSSDSLPLPCSLPTTLPCSHLTMGVVRPVLPWGQQPLHCMGIMNALGAGRCGEDCLQHPRWFDSVLTASFSSSVEVCHNTVL